jgi:ribosomal protein S18 acetylase RimI-like enzyme
MCAGVFVNPDTAFIGLYAVSPKYQKLGIGIRMWRQIMTHIGDRNAGLYAVPEHLVMYRDRAGFTHEDNKLLYIYESDTVRTVDLVKNIRGTRIKRIDVSLIPQIIEYDTQVHGYSRAKLLPHVFSEGDTISLAAIDEYDNKVVGYGSFRTNNISNGFGLFNPYSI